MKLIVKIIFPILLLSCASQDIKVSKFAKIDERDEYENNYISNKKKSIDKSEFFEFFFDNIFNPPKKKKFVSLDIDNKIYKKNDLYMEASYFFNCFPTNFSYFSF